MSSAAEKMENKLNTPRQTGRHLDFRGFRLLALAAYALLNVLYLLSCMQRTAIPGAIFNDIQGELGLLGSQVTRLGTVYVYSCAVLQIFAGMAVDRYGGKRSGILGGLLLGAGMLLFATARDTTTLYASRVVAAAGQAFMYLCVVKIAHALFPPWQFAALNGLCIAIGSAGGILGTLPAQRIAQFVGWRPLFLGTGLCSIAAVAAIALALSPLHERRRESGIVTWATLRRLFNDRGRLCLMIYDFWVYPSYFILQAVLGQKFIQDWFGCSASTAAAFTMTLTLATIATSLLGAPALRLTGGRRLPLVRLSKGFPPLLAAVMLAGVVLRWPAWVFFICFALMSMNYLGSAASSALMSELTDTGTIAFTAAVRNSFPFAGAGVCGGICGAILDRFAPTAAGGVIHYPVGAYIAILAVMAAFGTVGFLTTLGVPETRGRHLYRPDDVAP